MAVARRRCLQGEWDHRAPTCCLAVCVCKAVFCSCRVLVCRCRPNIWLLREVFWFSSCFS